MKKYIEPEINVLKFIYEDIMQGLDDSVITNNGGNGDFGEWED